MARRAARILLPIFIAPMVVCTVAGLLLLVTGYGPA